MVKLAPSFSHLWSKQPLRGASVCFLYQIYADLLLVAPFYIKTVHFPQCRQSLFVFLSSDTESSKPTVIIKTVHLHISSFFNSTVTWNISSPRKDNIQPLLNYLFSHHPKKMTNANSGPFPSWASKCSLVLKKVNPFRFCILICQLRLIVEKASVKVIVHKHMQEH